MTEQPPETGIVGYDLGPLPDLISLHYPYPQTQTQDTHQEACGIHD